MQTGFKKTLKKDILCVLRDAVLRGEALSYRQIIDASGLEDNLSTRNSLSILLRDDYVAASGKLNHYLYSITELGLELLKKYNFRERVKLRELVELIA